MLEYLQSVKHQVCLVSVDFAGLCSRSHIIRNFLDEYPSTKKIIIENFIIDVVI